MATTQEYINQLKIDKQNLVSKLNEMGVEANNSETFTSLVPKISTIVTSPVLQNKSINITENGTQNIEADEGYDGLSIVNVTTNVPSSGETPEKGIVINEWNSSGYPTKINVLGIDTIPYYYFYCYYLGSVTVNGYKHQGSWSRLTDVILANSVKILQSCAFQNCINLTNINLNNVNHISSSCFNNCTNLSQISNLSNVVKIGSSNHKSSTDGTAFKDCKNLGFISLPSDCQIQGASNFAGCTNLNMNNLPAWEEIPNYTFQNCENLALTNLPNTLTSIGQYAFQNCSSLALTNLPDSVTELGQASFLGCSNITIKKIPDLVTEIAQYTFMNCSSITQISMNNVEEISAGTNTSPFANTGLKAVWIGSAISGDRLSRYAFRNANSLEKMFINLPRAIVEGFNYYQYAFMNDTTKTGIIICNDDEDFLTKEEFDAIDWSTYTEGE